MKVERIIVRVPGIQGAIGNIPKVDKEFFAEKIKEAQEAAQSATSSASDAQSSAQDAREAASSATLSAQSAKDASASASEHDASAQAAQKAAEEARDVAKSAETIATSKAESATISAEQAANSLSLAVAAQSAAKTSQDVAQASADESAKSAKESAQSAASAGAHDESARNAAQAASTAQTASEEARDAAQAHKVAALASSTEAKKQAEDAKSSALASATSATSAAESALEAASAESNSAKHESASANSAQVAQAAQAASEEARDAAKASAASSLASQNAASESATAASANAKASASSASEAAESAKNASSSATASSESATKAKVAQDAAESAKSDAETARDDAQSWASSSAGSATDAASSATSASASKASAEESASSAKESADKIEALKPSIEAVVASSADIEKVAGVSESVVSCAENIDAIVATGGTLGLTVSAESGDAVGVEKTLQDGVYNLKFTIPSGGAGSSDSVLYVEQELTDEQKSQARTNISAVGVDASGNVSVAGKLTANSVTVSNGRIDIKSGIGSLYGTSNDGVSEVSLATSLSGSSGVLKVKSSGVMTMNGTTVPLSVNGVTADESGNIEISTSGSSTNVFTEQVTFEQGCKLKKGFELDASTASYDFGYNWDDGTGPGFAMRGSSFTGTGDGPGCFVFWARKDKSGQVKLVGSPTGSLQWNNGNVDVISSVTKNTATSKTFVIEHQNGFKEMGGHIEISLDSSPVILNFPKSFNSAPNIQLTGELTDSMSSAGVTIGCFLKNITTKGADIYCGSNNIKGVYWRASGF